MTRAELENGLPRAELVSEDSRDKLQDIYGNFATSVLMKVKEIDPEAPKDILIIGDNWLQLITTREAGPDNEFERMLEKHGAFFGDKWPIMERQEGEDIFMIVHDLHNGVKAGTLDKRILNKIAVLDLTAVNPVIQERDLSHHTNTPWGVSGILRQANTFIYHITSGFPRQAVQKLESPENINASISVHLFGDMKWD